MKKAGYFNLSFTVNQVLWKIHATAKLKGGEKWASAHG